MSQFEFLMAIASVLIAIGMAEIVSGWGRLLRSTLSVKLDWLYLLWTVLSLVAALVYWTSMWPYGNAQFTHMYQVWFLVIPSLFLVMLAYAVTPQLPGSGEFCLRSYYQTKQKQIFGSHSMFLALAALADYLIVGSLQLVLLCMSLLVLTLAFVRQLWIHYCISVAYGVLTCSTAFIELQDFYGDISTQF